MSQNGRQEWLDQTFGVVCRSTHCSEARRRTLEEVIQLAVEIAREGREGRKIGTLFVIGRVDRPEFRETVKEFAQLDGAFVLRDDGIFVSAGRYIDVDVASPLNFLPGLGTRHAAAASVSRTTGAVAVVVSQSSVVRVFAGGDLRAEIIPELFLMSQEQLFTPHARITQMPAAGITLAVPAETGG
jgi:diadenylate cyclase